MGFGANANKNLVAVFDATGYSVGTDRWKLSQRVCFVELATSLETARRVRELMVGYLTNSGTLPALEAVDDGKPFWESVVDERALNRQTHHRLVWCDIAEGEPELPEDRPLVPYALLDVRGRPDSEPEIQSVPLAEEVSDDDWVRLGSVWTSAVKPTEQWNGGLPRRVAPVRTTGTTSTNAAWVEYKTDEGHSYYHNLVTRDTVWELPADVTAQPANPPATRVDSKWKIFHTETGDVYYHNEATEETRWTLPPGATFR